MPGRWCRGSPERLITTALVHWRRPGWESCRRLPFSIKVLLEAALRQCDGFAVTEDDVASLAGWTAQRGAHEVPFKPARVILQDFTGVPGRGRPGRHARRHGAPGRRPAAHQPAVPVDLVIDHSVQVDYFGTPDALQPTPSWSSSATASATSF